MKKYQPRKNQVTTSANPVISQSLSEDWILIINISYWLIIKIFFLCFLRGF